MASTDKSSRSAVSAPSHHPAPELLVDYASGATTAQEALLIDLHLELCIGCRRSVRVLFAAGGEMLDSLPVARLAPDLFNKVLQGIDRTRVDAVPFPWRKPAAPAVPAFAEGWPRPIRRHIAQHGVRQWRWMPGGFRALRLPFADPSSRVWVMSAPGGRGPFPHGHTRDEWTVVLEGGYTDETGTYAAGDFAFAGPEDAHTIIAEPAEGCVCVLLVRADPVYTTWPGKLLAPLIRL